jgi:uncharacterized protein (DUF362 family)
MRAESRLRRPTEGVEGRGTVRILAKCPDPMELPTLRPSPFAREPHRPKVDVAFGHHAYQVARNAIAQIDLGVVSGARVLVKPNAGRVAPPGSGTNTSPEVVAAVVDALCEAGARVSVGDSPIAGVGPREALEASGIAAVVQKRGIPLLDLDERPSVTVRLPHGRALDRIKVCADVFEHDVIVSVPVAKTHMHTGVTLAVKNMKGCLWRRSKVALHMLSPVEGMQEKPLDIAICDMARVLRPHLSIVDGVIGMQGLGPSGGKPKPLGAVVVGVDSYAADAVACALMGRNAEAIDHLRLGAEQGYGVIDLGGIDVSPADWAAHTDPFDQPPTDIAIEYPNVRVLDVNSCSACQSTLMMYLKRYGPTLFDYFPDDHPVTIAIGKGHRAIEEGALCLGNCTAAHKSTGIFVPGCPPVVSAIQTVLERGPAKDDERR